jgi:hypothetical protein
MCYLPDEIVIRILEFLCTSDDLGADVKACSHINKQWQQIIVTSPKFSSVFSKCVLTDYGYLFKILVVGDLETRNTNLCRRLAVTGKTTHLSANVGGFVVKIIEVDNYLVKVQLWDQYCFNWRNSSVYRGAQS